MQENNFEKQVQQKMEGLRMDPSGESWQKVSAQIGNKKRDHSVLLVCLAALLVLLVGGLTWMKTTSPEKDKSLMARAENAPTAATTNETSDPATRTTNAITQKVQQKAPETNTPGNTDNKTADQLPATIQTLRNHKYPGTNDGGQQFDQTGKTNPRSIPRTNQTSSEQNNNIALVSTNEINQATATESERTKAVDVNERDPAAEILNDHSTNGNELPATVPAVESMLIMSQNLKTAGPEIAIQDLSAALPKIAKAARWKFGLNISGGISNTRNSYLGIAGNSSDENKDLFQSPPSGSTGNNGIPSSPAAGFGNQSEVKMKNGFIAGAFVQREISRRTSLQVGLNYKYYSTAMMTGSRIDSFGSVYQQLSNAYYRPGSQQKYINRYHFLELPVGAQVRVNAPYRKPVYVYAGITVSRLVKTSALQFNTFTNTYSRDNGLLNKTQFDLSGKLLFALSRNSHALLLGPQLNYSLGKMSETGMYQNRRYSYLGLTLQKNIF